MGIDYEPVAGYGIHVSPELESRILEVSAEDNTRDAIEKLGFEYMEVDRNMDSVYNYYIVVDQDEISLLMPSCRKLVSDLKTKLDHVISIEDIRLICDLHIC